MQEFGLLEYTDDEAAKMLGDLTCSYLAAVGYYEGAKKLEPGIVENGGSTLDQLCAYMQRFSDQFCGPDGQFAIRQRDSIWCFCKAVECDRTESQWNVIDARQVIEWAAEHSDVLVSLTYSVLRAAAHVAGIGTWYNGGMEWAREWLDDRMAQAEAELIREDADSVKEAVADLLACYDRGGAAYEAARLIESAPIISPRDLATRLSSVPRQNEFIRALVQLCNVMADGLSIHDFDNPDLDRDFELIGETDGVTVPEQFTICYDSDDDYSATWLEWLQMRSQEGYDGTPIGVIWMDPRGIDGGVERERMIASWPRRLQEAMVKVQIPND